MPMNLSYFSEMSICIYACTIKDFNISRQKLSETNWPAYSNLMLFIILESCGTLTILAISYMSYLKKWYKIVTRFSINGHFF